MTGSKKFPADYCGCCPVRDCGPFPFVHTWLSALGHAHTLVTSRHDERAFAYSVSVRTECPSTLGSLKAIGTYLTTLLAVRIG